METARGWIPISIHCWAGLQEWGQTDWNGTPTDKLALPRIAKQPVIIKLTNETFKKSKSKSNLKIRTIINYKFVKLTKHILQTSTNIRVERWGFATPTRGRAWACAQNYSIGNDHRCGWATDTNWKWGIAEQGGTNGRGSTRAEAGRWGENGRSML